MGKLTCARIDLTCGFLRSIVSASVTGDTGTVSTHRYNEYQRYEGGQVANFSRSHLHTARR